MFCGFGEMAFNYVFVLFRFVFGVPLGVFGIIASILCVSGYFGVVAIVAQS